MKHTGCLHFITLMNLLHLPTSVNCPQDIILHIQVVHRLQVKSMHSLIRVWFLNPFRLPSSQCEAYRQHLYKCQCCFVVDCILQILFSSYHILLSFNQSLAWLVKLEKFNIPELQTYVNGIRQDIVAVKNGIAMQYNNGLAEGSVNKLKVIKRIMYGRNSFELLKAKVLLHEQFRCEIN